MRLGHISSNLPGSRPGQLAQPSVTGFTSAWDSRLPAPSCQIALLTLLRRLPDLHITIPADEIKYPHGMATYGVHELPVGWW